MLSHDIEQSFVILSFLPHPKRARARRPSLCLEGTGRISSSDQPMPWTGLLQFPDDPRNGRAAELLDRLAPEIAALNGGPLHLRLESFIVEDAFNFEISSTLKAIGFRYFPQSGRQLLEDIVADLERQYPSRPYLVIV